MTAELRKVRDREDLVRDMSTGAILSTSRSDYEAAKRRRAVSQMRDDRDKIAATQIIELRAEVEKLKTELSKLTDVKEILARLEALETISKGS